MLSGAPAPVRVAGEHLVGRKRERAVLNRLLEAARSGDDGVLLVHGEPGVGKTALLEYAVTPQVAQVSHLAAQGHTNREIATRLFVSPSTVEYHLRKAFRKLDVKTRTQLARRIS